MPDDLSTSRRSLEIPDDDLLFVQTHLAYRKLLTERGMPADLGPYAVEKYRDEARMRTVYTWRRRDA